ncbi:MAG: cell division protein ZapA [Bdellovibrionales bacterium]|nr:cell division protein ZapA [Bdellovibrionales bacterium]
MDPLKKIYDVEVAGVALKLRSSHDISTVNELVALVNEKVSDVKSGSQSIPHEKALLLAALHLAEEITLLKKSALSEIDQIEARVHGILNDLESSPVSQIRMDV